jgi:hypothetical protein
MSKTIILFTFVVSATEASRIRRGSHTRDLSDNLHRPKLKVDARTTFTNGTEEQVLSKCVQLGCGTPSQERRLWNGAPYTFQELLNVGIKQGYGVRLVSESWATLAVGPKSCGCDSDCASLGICCSDFQATCMGGQKGSGSTEDGKDEATEDPPPKECDNIDPEAAKQELHESLSKVFGLEEVKAAANKLISRAVVETLSARFHKGIGKTIKGRQNFAFLGPPGTGKTMISKLLSKAFCRLGMVKHEGFLEVRPDELIGAYLGQTQKVVKERLKPGLGGVIFIDEAYLLTADGDKGSGGNQYQQEAVGVLMKLLDEHKDDTVFVFAGYVEDMEQFFKSNDGLKRRIPEIFRFEPFSVDNLVDIMMLKAQLSHSSLLPNVGEWDTSALVWEYGTLRHTQSQILFSHQKVSCCC